MKNLSFIIRLILLVLILSGCDNKYIFSDNRTDDVYILNKEGIVIVKPTIIDSFSTDEYIIGILLPTEYLDCQNGDALKIIIRNERKYFILFKQSGEVINFSSKEKFITNLKELKVEKNNSLNFSRFDSIWKTYSGYYENIDFSNCNPTESNNRKD